MSEQALKQNKVDWLLPAQLVWSLLAIAALVIFIAALPGYATKFGGQLGHATGTILPPGSRFFAVASGVASLASALLSAGLSALLFRRKFGEPMAVLLSYFLLLYATVFAGPLEFAAGYWLGSAQFGIVLQGLVIPVPLIALLLLFPNGRFVPGWTRWVLLLALPWNVAMLWLVPFDGASFGRAPLLFYVVTVLFIGFALTAIYSQLYRYRRAATYNERQQIRWAAYGFALWIGYVLLSTIPYATLSSLPPDAPTPWWGPASELGWWISLSILPLCLTIAITRYRLWDIDVVINRTLVYGALTAIILALYGLLVGGMGALFQTQGNWLVTLVITGLVAVLFQPLRGRLQHSVNRLLYGHRDEPLEVLARLGQRLEDALPPEQVLPTLVETIAQTLKLPYAAITMALHTGQVGAEQTAAAYGKPAGQVQTFPLIYQGTTIGHLHVAPRAAEESFTPAEARLLQNIARQAGTTVHALQLTADLQQARQQIVSSREEERRRLRRDLHDGLGPSLAATLLKIGSARALLARQPETTDQLLAEMETDIETTLADVRRIVYDLRPPALDQFGLVGALRAYAETCESATLSVRLDAADPLPPLPAAVEVAAYHIGREGLTNVVRHAEARRCTLKLCLENGRLYLTLQDDGRGFADGAQAGVGLAAMRERAEELGGSCTIAGKAGEGVLVTAVLPLNTSE